MSEKNHRNAVLAAGATPVAEQPDSRPVTQEVLIEEILRAAGLEPLMHDAPQGA